MRVPPHRLGDSLSVAGGRLPALLGLAWFDAVCVVRPHHGTMRGEGWAVVPPDRGLVPPGTDTPGRDAPAGHTGLRCACQRLRRLHPHPLMSSVSMQANL
jgi:hypothetical protein